MISLTEFALEKLKNIAAAEGLPLSIRLKVNGGGCAGFVYDMFFDEKISETDECFDQNELKIIVDQLSFQYLDGTIIDYVESDLQSGFKFLNPSVKSTCGCGSSFNY